MDSTESPAAADLGARFRAMRVADPTPPPPQPQPPFQPTTMRQFLPAPSAAQQYHQLSSSHLQTLLPEISGADLMRRLDLPPAPALQYRHHPQMQPQSYGMGESSTGYGKSYGGMGESSTGGGNSYGGMGESSTFAGYVPPYASTSIYASHFGKHSPRPNAAAAPTLPRLPGASAGQLGTNPIAPPNPLLSFSSLSPSANQFQPMSMAPHLAAAAAAAQYWDPPASQYWDPPASQYWDTPASQYWDTSASEYWDGHDSIFNPYASAFQSMALANPVDYGWLIPSAAPRWHTTPTKAQVRARLFGRPMETELLSSPVTSAHLACLLQDGDLLARRSVLATFKSDVHCFVESSAHRQAVLLALVRACMPRADEIEDIVDALYQINGFLCGVAKHNHGLTALKELFTAAVDHPGLLKQLMDWLLREPLFYECPELIEHCFVTLPYDHCKILIRFATAHIAQLLSSSPGSRTMAHCYLYARNGELEDLEKTVLEYTTVLATGQYGNYFLQRAIESGSEGLQIAITERVAADVVSLSMDQFGSYVVESCIVQRRSLAPLQLLLNAFLALDDGDLAGLVRGDYSNYVVTKLLEHANECMRAEARELARRIERLPVPVLREMHARGVMTVVKKLSQSQSQRQRPMALRHCQPGFTSPERDDVL